MKKNNKTVLAGFATCLLFSHSVFAEVTANVSATSNYLWRGVTQTGDAAAISGGIDFTDENGFYVGTWASNVDFGSDSPGYEIDFYAGYSQQLETFSYDIGYIYYAYPDAEGDIDFSEFYASVSWEWLTAKASYLTHAQSDSSSEEDMLYLELNASFEILTETELSLHLGQSSGDTVMEWFGEDDSYIDYGIALSKSGFTFGLSQTDLNADDDVKVYVSYGLDFSL